MDFRYLAQSRRLSNSQLSRITASLQLFHSHKQTILAIGARVGKGNKHMDHFQIPKLEFMHSVVPSILASGAVMQWSADRTEHAHITEIKIPGRSGNNRSYHPQICRHLDRSEKHRNFSLALSIQELQMGAGTDPEAEDIDDSADLYSGDDDDEESLLGCLLQPDLFARTIYLSAHFTPSTPLPLRVQHTNTTAFQLNFHPSLPPTTVDEAAIKFNLPDLRPALADYVQRSRDLRSSTTKIGQHQMSPHDATLPFTHLRVWYSIRMQMRSSDATGLTDLQRVSAMPVTDNWPSGRYDTVLLSNGMTPGPGLEGKYIFSPSPLLDTDKF